MAEGNTRTLFKNLKVTYGDYHSRSGVAYNHIYEATATVELFVAGLVPKGTRINGKLTVRSSFGGLILNEASISVVCDGSEIAKLYSFSHSWHGNPEDTITTKFEWTNPYAGKIDTGSNTVEVDPPALRSASMIVQGEPTFGQPIEIGFDSEPRAKHRIYYNNNAGQKVVIAENVEYSYTWTIPNSMANSLTEAPCLLILKSECYDTQWGNQIVNSMKKGLEIKPSDAMKPDLTMTIADTNSSIATKFGQFVKGKSLVKATVSFAGKYNATLKSGTVKKGSETLNITKASQTLTFQGVVDSTTVTVTGTVIDSRDSKKTVAVTQPAYDWAAPKVTTFKVTRCNQDGTANDAGEYAKVQFNVSISPCGNKNNKSLQIQYKKRADSSWTSQSITMSGYTLNSNIIVPADTESVYDFKINLTDYFQTTTAQVYLSTAFTLMDFHKGGKGMAIGKVAEEPNVFDVGIASRFRKGLNSDAGWAVLRNKETQNDFNTLYFYSNDGTSDIHTGCFIRAYDDDENGSIFVMRSGGAFIAGGGEFASSYYADNKTSLAGTEQAFFGADSAVNIIAGYNTPANAKRWIFNASGNITTPSGGLINGKDITKLAGFYTANTTSAQVGQTTENRVVVRTNGSQWNETGLIANHGTINLYDYTDNEQIWRINIREGDTVNVSEIKEKINSGNLSPTYRSSITLFGIWAGHVTNRNSSLDFFVPLQKAIPSSCVIDLPGRDNDYFDISVRGPNGYLNGHQYLGWDDCSPTLTFLSRTAYGMMLRLNCVGSSWTNISNNRPVSVTARIDVKYFDE